MIGRTLGGNYVIERKIGDGGMGHVYAARHTRVPARFAIKVLHHELGQSEEVFRRFQHEAEILASLRHPHIVQVTDFERLSDGTIYLVMEYLEGEDMQARILRRGRLELHEVLGIARQVGSALLAAHKHGVVHRDLKPQNLFLAQQDHGDRMVEAVKVLDFGVSKILRTGEEDLTRVGRILGTPQFMAPEQARGQNQLIDARADQFALGAILYYALSGQLPFAGSEATAVLYQVLYEMPPKLHELVAVPADVSEALERALSKEPAGRFASIGDLTRALDAAAQGTVVSAPVRHGRSAPGKPQARALPEPTLDEARGRSAPAHRGQLEAEPTVMTTPGQLMVAGGHPPQRPQQRRGASDDKGTDTKVPLPDLSTTLSGGSGTLEGLPRRRGKRALLSGLLVPAGLLGCWLLVRSVDRGPARPPAPPQPGRAITARPAQAPAPTSAPPPAAPSPSPPAMAGGDLSGSLAEGAARLRAGDVQGARRAFEQAMRIDPRNSRAMAGLGEVEMEQHNYGGALRWLREAAAREPDYARHHLLACQVRFRLGDLSGARAACNRVLLLDPDSSDAQLMLRSMVRR